MIQKSRRRYLLCDSSKFDQICLNTLCTKDEIDRIITDKPFTFDS